MKTISSCFTCIVAIMFGLFLNGMCLFCNFIEKDWRWFAWDIIAIMLGILAIRWLCDRAKRIEESMRHSIDLTIIISEPKDKDNEVEADK